LSSHRFTADEGMTRNQERAVYLKGTFHLFSFLSFPHQIVSSLSSLNNQVVNSMHPQRQFAKSEVKVRLYLFPSSVSHFPFTDFHSIFCSSLHSIQVGAIGYGGKWQNWLGAHFRLFFVTDILSLSFHFRQPWELDHLSMEILCLKQSSMLSWKKLWSWEAITGILWVDASLFFLPTYRNFLTISPSCFTFSNSPTSTPSLPKEF